MYNYTNSKSVSYKANLLTKRTSKNAADTTFELMDKEIYDNLASSNIEEFLKQEKELDKKQELVYN